MTGPRLGYPAVDWRGFLLWACLIGAMTAAALALIP